MRRLFRILFWASVFTYSFAVQAEKKRHDLQGGADDLLNALNPATDAKSVFTAKLDCEFACKDGGKAQSATLSKTFSAKGRGLAPGNGGYFGQLSWNIWAWGREQCLDNAAKTCGGKDKSEEEVASFKLKSMTSKNWKVEQPIDCNRKTPIVFSPFGAGIGIEFDPKAERGVDGRIALKGAVKQTEKDCKTPIKGEMCFGDCAAEWADPALPMGAAKEWRETLSTPTPNGSNDVIVCGESFVTEYESTKLTADVLKHYCENFFWNSTLAASEKGFINRCAATRISALGCETLVRDVLKR